jgi:hypothetical protein
MFGARSPGKGRGLRPDREKHKESFALPPPDPVTEALLSFAEGKLGDLQA